MHRFDEDLTDGGGQRWFFLSIALAEILSGEAQSSQILYIFEYVPRSRDCSYEVYIEPHASAFD